MDDVNQEQFAVIDVRSANLVLRRIAEVRRYAQAVDEWADAEKNDCADIEEVLFARYGSQLEEFARTAVAEQNERFGETSRSFIRLPAGILGFSEQVARLKVVDEQEVIEWCRHHLPAAIRVTERVSRTDINGHFQVTGQIPQGTILCDKYIRFYVK